MAAESATAVIAASGALVLAAASYWFTKRREREAELRKEKLDHYKEFAASLSGIISGEDSPEGQRAFAAACNRLNLIAPYSVLQALQAYQIETKVGNASSTLEMHDKLLSALFFEIRRDLGVSPRDRSSTFSVQLWASGTSDQRIAR